MILVCSTRLPFARGSAWLFYAGVKGWQAPARRNRKEKTFIADNATWTEEQIDYAIKKASNIYDSLPPPVLRVMIIGKHRPHTSMLNQASALRRAA